MSERRERALDIARRALDAPADRRAHIVDEACAADAALRDEVHTILRRHDAGTIVGGARDNGHSGDAAHGGHDDQTRVPRGPDAASDEGARGRGIRGRSERGPAGRTMGGSEILDVLGEGGMGVVYLARQNNPRREVALKVIRPGWVTERMLRRFEFETSVLARLEHPGIGRIYEAGTFPDDGDDIPFFAMEYVRGQMLTEWAAAKDRAIKAKLEMFAKVCDAVHHAHQKGVIHRDLKPGNILVDPMEHPKVLDFGVARATEGDTRSATLATEAGQVIGTIPYMSPEQVLGDHDAIDTRTDVYALGVVLYEMLTGRLPLDVEGKTIIDAARIISNDRPRALRSSDRTISPELQTIAEHAMAKERDRRYQSAGELAADVRRFLNGEPISAQPPSVVYQLRKFAQRNKALVAATLVIILSLAGALAGVSWQAVVASHQRDRAQREAAIAQRVTGYLSAMLESADPEQSQGEEISVRQVLDYAAATISELDDQPVVQAAVRGTLGRTYMSLGQFDRADEELTAAYATLSDRLGQDDRRTIDTHRSLGVLRAEQDRFEEAEAIAREVWQRQSALFGPDDPGAISSQGELARTYEEEGRLEEAEALLRDALARAMRVMGPDDANTLVLRHNLASNMRSQSRFEEAEKEARIVLEARRRVFGDRHPQTLYALNNLATIRQRMGDLAGSEDLLRECYSIRIEVMGPEHPTTMSAAQNLANSLILQGKREEAEPLQRHLLSVLERTLGDQHQKTLVALNALAYLLEDEGKLDEAETMYRRVVEATELSAGANNPEVFPPLNNLAMLLQQLGRLDEADAMFRKLLSSAGQSLPEDHLFMAIFGGNYGECLVDMGRLSEAEPRLVSSERVLRAKLGDANPRTTKGVSRLVRLYEELGDEARAAQWRAKLPKDAPE